MCESRTELASLRRRLASLLYESLLLVSVTAGLMVPLWLYSAFANRPAPPSFYRVYFFLGYALYFIWHWQHGRQTLAMRTWRLHLRAADGQPLSMIRLALRYVLAWPSIGFCGIGLLWAFFDRDRQFLHDRLSGTRIIFVRPTTASTLPPTKT